MQPVRRGNGPLGTWSNLRKAKLWTAVVIVALMTVLLGLPLGTSALFMMVWAAIIWHHVGEDPDHPNLGLQNIGTKSYKLEVFFTALHNCLTQGVLRNPRLYGFGAPREDPDHDVSEGWWPPTRLSSWWVLVISALLGVGEYYVAWLRWPIWHKHFTIPSLVVAIVGGLCWYVMAHMILAVRAVQGGNSDSVASAEPTPAVMLHKVRGVVFSSEVMRTPTIVTVVALIVAETILLAIGAPWIAHLVSLVSVALLFLCVSVSKSLTTTYRAPWQERMARQDFFTAAWTSVLGPNSPIVPVFMSEFSLPEADVSADPPVTPSVHSVTFAMPPGSSFVDDYLPKAPRLMSAVGASVCALTPMGVIENGQERPGTVGSSFFRLWYPEEGVDLSQDFLDPTLDAWSRFLVLQTTVMDALASITGIGPCIHMADSLITSPSSPSHVLKLTLVPMDPRVDLGSFTSHILDIQNALGVGWVRAMKSSDVPRGPLARGENGVNHVESASIVMLIAKQKPVKSTSKPHATKFRGSPRAVARVWEMIDSMEWSYQFMVSHIRTASGATPRFVGRQQSTPVVDVVRFELPPGLDSDLLTSDRMIQNIKQNAGLGFLEVQKETGVPDGLSEEEKILAEARYTPRMALTTAKEDPLKRAFPFGEFKDRILMPRQPGTCRLDWVAGVYADDSLAMYKSGSDAPHLLIGGESGCGKSVLVSNMLAQKTHNNGPDDYELWLIEPKTELQVWQDVDVCTHFVDSWTPDTSFFTNVADLLTEAVEIMETRNAMMADWRRRTGVQVRDIGQARKIAMTESTKNGTPFTSHPLWMRYIDVVMEECASIYSQCDKANAEDQARAMRASSELARKARSAGIFMTWITQYPTNASIPMTYRQMAARIGLRTKSSMSSNVIIDERGLEQIRIRGVGMLRDPKTSEYRRFRSFWMRDGVRFNGEVNDTEDLIDTLPKSTRTASVKVPGGRQNSAGATAPQTSGDPSKLTVSGSLSRTAPDMSQSVFAIWDAKYGRSLDAQTKTAQPA